MEKHCTIVHFSLRKSKQNKKGESPIEISISANKERVYFSSGKYANANDWNITKQLVKSKAKDANLINGYLIQARNKIYELEIELIKNGFIITAPLLRDAYLGRIEKLSDKTLLEVMVMHNEEQEKMVGINVSKATYWISVYTLRLLKEFIKKKYKREDIHLRELNQNFIQSFHSFLLKDKGMAQNSATKHLKLLKKIVNFAVYKIEREPVEIDFLDEEELRKIINFDTPIPRFERARDMFLFACFTGLAYIDIKTLTSEHIEKDNEGRIWIKKRRVKTGVLSRIPLLPIAKMILDKYKGGDTLLPIQASTDVNKYLKDIAILCGINKRITFHTGRHTFASTVTLSNNISLEVVSKMLGHTNIRMTTHYAKLVDKYIGEQMDKLLQVFSNK